MRSLLYSTLVIVMLAAVSMAAPEPAVVQGPGLWTLQARYEAPRQIRVQLGSNLPTQTYWYTILTVTNRTGEEVDFFHKCDLVTDTFQVVPAGKGVPALVFDLIKKRHESKYPFLEPLDKVNGKMREGEDYARDIAIIWPDFDLKAKGFNVYVTGLSNETAVVDHPVAKDEDGKPKKIFLRKTLELKYKLKGGASLRSDADVVFAGKGWVMR